MQAEQSWRLLWDVCNIDCRLHWLVLQKGVPMSCFSFERVGMLAVAALALIGSVATMATDQATPILSLSQGKDWTEQTRLDFYARDQGSRIMPLAWFEALRRADGSSFLPNGLQRYGYLDNLASPDRLPVGFTVDSTASARSIGMTCAACHTRELENRGVRYRVDGGPAIVDFQAFLVDMDVAVGRVLTDHKAFSQFEANVRSFDAQAPTGPALRSQVSLWYLRYHTLMERALPNPGWGLGRLDAVSMIFNRLTGLDIGPPPTFMIPDNIARADAPVRYPFIWDAPRQDHTQWPGFAGNGDDLLGLARNLGEVYGVFGIFQPHKSSAYLLGYDFVTDNSANFGGLRKLEGLVRRMKAPAWPWPIDAELSKKGSLVFSRPVEAGGCAACHAATAGSLRLVPPSTTWKTPQVDVGSDTREYQVIARMASSGAIDDALKPSLGRLKPVDRSIDILATSVVGAILQHDFALVHGKSVAAQPAGRLALVPAPTRNELAKAFKIPSNATAAQSHRYEARVLHGIWAAAPYLHNGSVPSLRELLTPPAQRVAQFAVGRNFDEQNVGLSKVQTGLSQQRITSACDQLDSGNSRCGHDYGTRLSDDDKRALIEYLKTL